MAPRKRLTLLVEGEGDVQAVPALVNRLLEKHGGGADLFTDNPMKVGNLFNLLKKGSEVEWLRFAGVAAKRRDLAGILLLIDGDCDGNVVRTASGKEVFCAAKVAEFLAERAKATGAGSLFSLAVVFARQEYESWLIAGHAEQDLRLRPGVRPLTGNLEDAPRSAKEWLVENRLDGYKPTRHQKQLTASLDLDLLARRMRSFRRLDSAVQQIIAATRTQRYIVSPAG
jgi:hypothetical protein